MGQVGQMLNQNNFLGGLGNLEGSFLIGMASIIFSLAIAVIPFIAKRIVSGDVGSTTAAMIGSAVTALTAGAAAFEGAAAGVAAGGAGASAGSQAGGSAGAASAGAARPSLVSAGSNQPNPAQSPPRASTSGGNQAAGAFSAYSGSPTMEAHAEQMRSSISEAMGMDGVDDSSANAASSPGEPSNDSGAPVATAAGSSIVPLRSNGTARRGPTVHRYNLGTWGAYHVARLATRSLVGVGRRTSDKE